MRRWLWLTILLAGSPSITFSDIGRTAMKGAAANSDGPIVVLGASYAGGWDLRSVAGTPVINRGVAGQQSFEMLERFERDVVPARPRAVIIWGFINDLFGADPPHAQDALDRARDSYTRMIELARQYGIEPVLATEVTIRPQDTWPEAFKSWIGFLRGKESYEDRINRQVLETNHWLVQLGKAQNLFVLDLQAALAESTTVRRRREFTQDDGSHITQSGYAALTAYATAVLKEHFATRQGGS